MSKWTTRIPRAVLLVLAAISAASAGERAPAADAMAPIELGQIKVGGEIGRRVEITARKNLLALDVEKDFLTPFRTRGRDKARGGYVGLGKLIDAAVRFAAYTGDADVIALKKRVVRETIKTQEPDGYIGIFPPEKRLWTLWDVSDMAYVVFGLSSDWQLFKEQPSLDAARKLTDFMIARWLAAPPGKPLLGKLGVNGQVGFPEALLEMHQCTAQASYVDFAVRHLKLADWNERKILGHHAYGYLAESLAQLRLYGLRADPKLLESAHRAVDFMTRQDGLLVPGCCSLRELWHEDQTGSGNLAESCATAYLLWFLDALVRLEPNPLFGDIMERTIHNALFAAQSPDGRQLRYFTPLEGPRVYFRRDDYCCPNNFRRIIADLPTMVYYRSGGGLAFNLYTPSTAKVELGGGLRLTVRQETDYPNSGRVLIRVDPSRRAEFPLRLRIPRWCTKPAKVAVNGQAIGKAISRGSLVTIDRPWQPGDKIKLDMSMSWRWIKGRKAQAGRFALMRGPLVFCLSPVVNRLPKDMDVRKIVIDPKTVGEPSEDQRVCPDGLACRVRAWSPGRATTQPSDLELLLTEFPDPSGTATYHLLSDPSMSQDDELVVAGK